MPTKRSRLLRPWTRRAAAAAVLFAAGAAGLAAAAQSGRLAPYTVKFAGKTGTNFHYHLTLPAQSVYRSIYNFPPRTPGRAPAHISASAGAPFFPADVTNEQHGPVVASAQSNDVYVNCRASCWGDPEGFLRNIGASSFMHIVDQYVGDTAPRRYTVGASYSVHRTIYNGLDSNELLAIVDEASRHLGTGYHHIYHVFLPRGVDTCVYGTTDCYSPDNQGTFQFCAYHVSVDLPGNRHVLYTVEPYQVVEGCSIGGSTPSQTLNDSTDSSLSHELFETISDPDSNGWTAPAQAVQGQEIGDLCGGRNYAMALGASTYTIQLEYSNAAHGCVMH